MANKATCCICISRRTGVMTIAILFVVCNVVLLLAAIGGWATVLLSMPKIPHYHTGGVYGTIVGYAERVYQIAQQKYSNDMLQLHRIMGGLGGVTVLISLGLLFSSLLVHGVRTGSAGKILSWIVFHGIWFAILTILQLAGVIVLFVYSLIGPALGALLVPSVVIGVFWYWWAVVVAYYRTAETISGDVIYRRQSDDVIPLEG